MIYPKILEPNSFEIFLINDREVQIPRCKTTFEKWNGIPLKNNFGGKPCVNKNETAMFAELATLNIFLEDGWNGRWIETYGKPKLNPIHLKNWIDDSFKNQIHDAIVDENIQKLLNKIAQTNDNNFGGIWDVVAWKNDKIIFTELKRNKKDYIQSTQNKWLKSALQHGLTEENFLLVEWNFCD